MSSFSRDDEPPNPCEPLASLLSALKSTHRGLSTSEVASRSAQLGANRSSVASVGRSVMSFARAALNPLVLILLVAGAASAFAGERIDALIIAAIVLSSSLLNFWQTHRSERAVRRLKAEVAPTATALRDARWVQIPRAGLVPGDVVRLSAGDLLPADVRLLESTDLHVQQAALTGESLPVEKVATEAALNQRGPECPHLVFLGTSVVSGTATAVVIAVGDATAFGDIVARLSERPEETEFERGTKRFSVLILKTVLFLVLFILVTNVAQGRDALQALLFSVALAVGLTPEFLPIITTVTLAEGAVQMAREKVIVKHLPAIQNLGSIDVLCSDKTGTLTAGCMSLDAALDPLGKPSARPLELAGVNSQFETGIRSPLDDAILQKAGETREFAKTDEIPFDFYRRRLSVVCRRGEEILLITKGAPESVLESCSTYEIDDVVAPFDEKLRERCLATFRSLSERGMRVLAVAYRKVTREAGFTPNDERELTLSGFLSFSDPVLPEVKGSIERLRRDGVAIKILTGDNELVARHVCSEVGIDGGRVVLGSELEHLDEPALARIAESADVFARLSPAQKHRLVRAMKAHGHVVGFMGDGINDAPSLHGADVGISVAGAVDVAREASDIILLERHLDVLHAGILAGRASFGNVLKYLLMGTSSNFGNMVSMAAATLFLPFLPMLPPQILLNNFLYDAAQVTIPTDNVDPSYVNRPQRWNIGLIRNFMLVIGPLSSLYDFLTFFVLLRVFRFDEARFHTGWFVESLATQTLVLFVIRTAGRPWKSRPSAALTITILAVVAVGGLLPYSPLATLLGFEHLPPAYYVFLFAVLATYLALVEFVKRRMIGRLLSHLGSSERGLERA